MMLARRLEPSLVLGRGSYSYVIDVLDAMYSDVDAASMNAE